MHKDMNLDWHGNWSSRTILKALACLFLALGFYAGASAASSPLQSEEHVSPLSRSAAQSASRTPTLAPTRGLSALQKAPASALVAQSIPGQPTVDTHTVALYHFDAPTGNNQVIDATGRYTATLNGNATVTSSGLYAGVLQIDGNGSYVRTGHFDNVDFSQGTIEAYVDFNAACASGHDDSIISAGGEYGSNQPIMKLTARNGLMFGIYVAGNPGYWVYANSGINACRYLIMGGGGFPFPYDDVRFHHVAGTWGPRGIEIWVDGVLHGVGNTDPNSQTEPYPYQCNPQSQFGVQGRPPNPNAPYSCPTPVMYPTMASFPPGDYTGSLPAYSTFLIGCDATGACFNGSVDEVRISNIQRTFTMAVLPTNTPTPTVTPISYSGEYSVDANTVALFHFNPDLPGLTWEEVHQQNKGLLGQAVIVPGGRFGTGLELGGNGSGLGAGDLGSPRPGTIEAWVFLSNPNGRIPIFTAAPWGSSNLDLFLGASPQGNIGFGMFNGTDSAGVDSGVPPSALANCWHHIAGTWGPRGLEIWIDGVLENTNSSYTGGIVGGSNNWVVGCDLSGNCMNGVIDEVRVSDVQYRFSASSLKPVRRFLSSLPRPYTPEASHSPILNSGQGFLLYFPFVGVMPSPTPCS